MRSVAVTGVSGLVGQEVLRLLDGDQSVGRVVGIDAKDPALRPAKLEFHRVDLASAELKPLLEGVDVVVHLAFALDPAHDHDLLRRVNVEATRRLLDAAGSAGVRHVVYPSSAMVYGAWADNAVPLTEEAPVRPNPGFTFAAQKAEVERLLAEFRDDHPGTAVTVLRPAPVPAAARRSWLAGVWRGEGVRVRGGLPPVQFLHEADLAAAIALAIGSRLDGTFNVAPDGWVAGEDARALAGGARLPLPEGVVRRLLAIGWASGLTDRAPAVTPYLCQPWVVANDRLRAAGWAPTHSNEEAFVESSELPRWRAFAGRHRQELALGASAAVLAAGATTAVLLVRRSRRRSRASS